MYTVNFFIKNVYFIKILGIMAGFKPLEILYTLCVIVTTDMKLQ